MAHSQTNFPNAHDFTVNGGQFFSAKRMVFNNGSDNDPVSTTLWLHVAAGAIFDSAERFPPAKCHPGTRERMIERIVEWIDNPTPNQRILWLYGPAGSGKSALAHTICERYKDRCKGSFFFSRGLTDRGRAFKLFATLSYQLALQFPFIRTALNEALYRDPSLPTKSMEAQLLSLIIQPLLQCPSFPEHSSILIIDGLDECADDQGPDTQCEIISLISQSIIEHNIPLRFLIASRPESWIRDTFESSPLPSITLSLSLRDDIDADKDIRAYLTDEFEKIRMKNKRIMKSVEPPWPPTNIVDLFVYEASGQYIYASTVLKFVGKSSKHTDPQAQLRILTTPGPHRALAFSELDRLYLQIISGYPQQTTIKRVLGGILVGVNSTIIEIILGVDPTELTLVLDTLSPLIDIESPPPLSRYEKMLEPIYGSLTTGRERISLCHLSFHEFLEDESRSGPFHIDICDFAAEIIRSFFGVIRRNIDQNYATEPHLFWNIGLATYRHMMSIMAYETIELMQDSDIVTLIELVIGMKDSLLHLDPDGEMEYFGCFMADMDLFFPKTFIESSNWFGPQTHEYSEQEKDQLIHAISELKNAASLARKRCIHSLSTSKRFRPTPTLAYLYEFYKERYANVNTVFNIGHTVADVLYTLQQHRYIIDITHNDIWHEWILNIVSLDEDLLDDESANEDNEDEGWLTRGEWKDQRILIISQMLDATFNTSAEHAIGCDKWDWDLFYYVGRFFKSRNLSDIHHKKYFENPCNLSILALMTDFSIRTSWFTLQKEEWTEVADFIVPVLCWFNRQLTNSKTLDLLGRHNKNLVPKMKTTMNQVFEHLFFPNYRRPYHSELSVSTAAVVGTNSSIKMRVLPLPQGYDQEEIIYVRHEYLFPDYWCVLHNEIFGKTPQTQEGLPTIDRQCWHPYLASCLLNSLAKHLYRRVNPIFDLGRLEELTKNSFSYIVQCLPYAETTQQNLDSLRAIAYLFPQANLEWDLPTEFWCLSVEFLKKFDRSILSEEELNLFVRWMEAPYEPLTSGNCRTSFVTL